MIINNLDEMQEYYDSKTNIYVFYENGCRLKVSFTFNVDVESGIAAGLINAKDINCYNLDCTDIHAEDIVCHDLDCRDAYINNICAIDINSYYINAKDIDCCDIHAENITARNINADYINSTDISCLDLSYCGVCLAHSNIKCNSISGKTKNSKHFALNGKIEIKGVESE